MKLMLLKQNKKSIHQLDQSDKKWLTRLIEEEQEAIYSQQALAIVKRIEEKTATYIPDAIELNRNKNFRKQEVQPEIEQKIALYPNPFTNQLNINFNTNDLISWTIYSVEGRLIHQGKGNMTIETNHWQSGVYFLYLEDKTVQKLIKL